jgi:glycosyltransferase involved in cell wall biosynthesis
LPKSLIEAAACGRAVVTTDVPGCRDAIEPGITGLLVPPRDPGALADAIEHLIENPSELKNMGRAGRRLAEREFGIDKIVNQHLEIYRELLSND